MPRKSKKIEPVLRGNLLRLARAFMALTGKESLRTVSRIIHSDPPFFDKLAEGSVSFTARKYDEMVAAFTKHWPRGERMPLLDDPQHKGKSHGKESR